MKMVFVNRGALVSKGQVEFHTPGFITFNQT